MTIKNQIGEHAPWKWPARWKGEVPVPFIPWERIAAYAVRNALSEHPSDDPTEKLADAMVVLREWSAKNGANYYDAQARSRRKWAQKRQSG